MNELSQIYKSSLGLLTDLYQLTMAYGYWKSGIARQKSVFYMAFRNSPFGGAYAIACGIESVAQWIEQLEFSQSDLDYLASLQGSDKQALFSADFLEFLKSDKFKCRIDAVKEGEVVFPHEPLVRVEGPLWQAQWIETAVLTIVNFQTLIATKASRVCRAADGNPVLEFGLRRAQGIDGGLSASRAAFVGGCAATSNVLAGKLFDIPVRGTHAHSWVMAFDDEIRAFEAYSNAMPNNSVLLVDTYDTIRGVQRAIQQGKQLQEQGYQLNGIRLDSGDLEVLSKKSRELLDDANMPSTQIVASNDLDEYEISRLQDRGAPINLWGVGTKLSTAYDQPALGGVYKLSAIQDQQGHWRPVMKRSNQRIKQSLPGQLNFWRAWKNGQFLADIIGGSQECDWQGNAFVDRVKDSNISLSESPDHVESMLHPLFDQGTRCRPQQQLSDIQEYARHQLEQLPEKYKRISEPDQFPVVITQELAEMRRNLHHQSMEVSP